MFLIVAFLLPLASCSDSVPDIPWGEYEFESLFLYAFPSSVARVDYFEKGTVVVIDRDAFTITPIAKGKTLKISNPVYKFEKLDDEMTETLRKKTANLMGKSDLSEYKNKYRFNIYKTDENSASYSIYVMDDELWLAHYLGDISSEGKAYRKYDYIIRLKKR